MAPFQFELVTPEKLLFSGEVDQVDVPGAEGDFGVLANHAPIVATLRPGVLTIHTGNGEQKIVVLGGFAEFSSNCLTVLADAAGVLEEFDRALVDDRITECEQRISKTDPGVELDRLVTQLDHYKAINQHLTATAMH